MLKILLGIPIVFFGLIIVSLAFRKTGITSDQITLVAAILGASLIPGLAVGWLVSASVRADDESVTRARRSNIRWMAVEFAAGTGFVFAVTGADPISIVPLAAVGAYLGTIVARAVR